MSEEDSELFKKPNASTTFTPEQAYELARCEEDPFFFIRRFMKVEHAVRGSLPLILHPFQERLVSAFHTHNKVVALTARQMGKCVSADTEVTVDGTKQDIASLVKMTPKQRLVTWLERKLVGLAVKQS